MCSTNVEEVLMKKLRWYHTIKEFEKDVRFGHSVGSDVDRSEAGRVLVALAEDGALQAVTEYLEATPPPEKGVYPLVEENVRVGLVMLMANIGHALMVDVPHDLKFVYRNLWIAWAKSVYQAT
jgi:hypothetical protein